MGKKQLEQKQNNIVRVCGGGETISKFMHKGQRAMMPRERRVGEKEMEGAHTFAWSQLGTCSLFGLVARHRLA